MVEVFVLFSLLSLFSVFISIEWCGCVCFLCVVILSLHLLCAAYTFFSLYICLSSSIALLLVDYLTDCSGVYRAVRNYSFACLTLSTIIFYYIICVMKHFCSIFCSMYFFSLYLYSLVLCSSLVSAICVRIVWLFFFIYLYACVRYTRVHIIL